MAKKKSRRDMRLNREERREKRNKRLMGIVLTAVMVLAIAGIWAANKQSNNGDYSYGDYKFALKAVPEANNNMVYTTKVNGQEVFFYTLPNEAERINTTNNLTALLQPAQAIVLSSSPGENYASLHDLVRFELSRYSGKLVVGGTLHPNESEQLAFLSCANATTEMPVIELHEANSTSIVVENNCAVIDAPNSQLAVIRDRLLYSMLGILKN